MLDQEVLIGQHVGYIIFLRETKPKIFSLTINKAQTQIIPNIVIYVPQHVFRHTPICYFTKRCYKSYHKNSY
ncbi:hypothetical protein Lal_00021488 [Lupinus albus]|nr:hypothetical protein Lal_00021488 [Lupinus albus]